MVCPATLRHFATALSIYHGGIDRPHTYRLRSNRNTSFEVCIAQSAEKVEKIKFHSKELAIEIDDCGLNGAILSLYRLLWTKLQPIHLSNFGSHTRHTRHTHVTYTP